MTAVLMLGCSDSLVTLKTAAIVEGAALEKPRPATKL
jgi:hypothetical protein